MKPFLRLSGKVAIVLFCLWHMVAVLMYALPGSSQNTTVQYLRTKLSARITPYMLMTSQWQQWNLFSPDPLRRVTSYLIEVPDNNGTWTTLENLEPGALPWWRHAAQFKMLGSLLDGDTQSENHTKLAERYLQLKCYEHALDDGTPIRFSYSYFILPTPSSSMSVEGWWEYVPETTSYIGHETRCDHNVYFAESS